MFCLLTYPLFFKNVSGIFFFGLIGNQWTVNGHCHWTYICMVSVRVMVFDATFNNISFISWW